MIITDGKRKGGVLCYSSNGLWFCIMDEMLQVKLFNTDEISIEDNRIPNDWVTTSYYFKDAIPDWLFDFYTDNVFFCYPKSIKPSDLVASMYWLPEEGFSLPIEFYRVLKAMNEVRVFHGLEKAEIPYIEKYELELMTPEQRRQKAIDDELEEYLRIGEELSKTKQSEEK